MRKYKVLARSEDLRIEFDTDWRISAVIAFEDFKNKLFDYVDIIDNETGEILRHSECHEEDYGIRITEWSAV